MRGYCYPCALVHKTNGICAQAQLEGECLIEISLCLCEAGILRDIGRFRKFLELGSMGKDKTKHRATDREMVHFHKTREPGAATIAFT